MKNSKPIAVVACLQLALFPLRAQFTYQPQQLPPVTVQGAAPVPQADSSATTLVSGDEVRVGEITSVRDLSAQEPNLAVFDGNDNRTPKFSVRGFRENNFAVGEPVVGMYVDDVPYFDLNSRGASLYEVQSIQFARGAQGTLYGASGVGGVMSITTKQPGNDWHGSAGAGYGDYNAQNYQFGLGGPIITNQLFLNLAGLYSLRDGYVYNLYDGSHPDNQNTLGGRAELRWTPSAPWVIAFTATGERFHDGFIPTYRPGPFTFFLPPPATPPYPTAPADPSPFVVDRNLDGFNDTSDDSQALKLSYDAGPALVTSVTTHRDWKQSLLQDYDFSALPPPLSIAGFTQPRVEQWGEELHVKSPDGADPFKWLAGFFYLDNELLSDSGSTGATTSLTDSDGQTYALFGQGTYTLFQKLDLTAGLRATFDDRSIHGTVVNTDIASRFYGGPSPINHSADFSAVQPKFALAWHFTPQVEAYASVAQGYQSGGFNSFVNNTSYNPARSWNYELGFKSSCDDNKYTTRAALFYSDTEGYQVIRINPANPLEANLLNAHRAVSYGAELEFLAKPAQDLDLSANAGYTRATYENFLDPTSGLQLAGKPISFVPEFTANLAATYHLPWHIYVRGEMIAVGRYHLDDAYTPEVGSTVQGSYELVNAQVGYEIKNFEIYLYARNIFDRHYFNNALNLGPGSGTSSLILQPGDPETCGIALTARF
ncbi:MAG: TonB-dependent receptor [Verrucomicrobiota bacterium]|jgi:iron complex outermembrane receptor protein